MSAAVWVRPGSEVKHRDAGCRYLDGACRGATIDTAVARGSLRELRAESDEASRLRCCGSCYSAAGYRRSPHDFTYTG